MATRVVEGKKPYTGGEAIDIDQNKVISLKLRDENNLIIYDSGDDEIYVDLQLPDGITPTDAFPVGVTTGRAVVADGWDKAGTIICAKTTSGDNIKLLYADDGTLWIDNGTGTFKQIYFKADVDALITTLTTYINTELAKKQNGVASATAPESPAQGDLWYDTTSDSMKVYDGTQWKAIGSGGGGGGDVYVSTQANNIFTTGMKIWGGAKSDYQSLTPDSNTAYLLLADQPTPPSPGWQPGVNTLLYCPLNSTDTYTDQSGNNVQTTSSGVLFGMYQGVDCAYFDNVSSHKIVIPAIAGSYPNMTMSVWSYMTNHSTNTQIFMTEGNNTNFALQPSSSGQLQSQTYDGGNHFITDGDGLNAWHHQVVTWENGTSKFYVDGQYIGSDSTSSITNMYISYGGIGGHATVDISIFAYGGYLSEAILEDKKWTAQEIADYYDQTKGDYGIS